MDGKLTFTMEAGFLSRGSIKREMQQIAWANNLDISFEESKGLLGSIYRVTVTGDGDKLMRYQEIMKSAT